MNAAHDAMQGVFEAKYCSARPRQQRAAIHLYVDILGYEKNDIEKKYYADGEDAHDICKTFKRLAAEVQMAGGADGALVDPLKTHRTCVGGRGEWCEGRGGATSARASPGLDTRVTTREIRAAASRGRVVVDVVRFVSSTLSRARWHRPLVALDMSVFEELGVCPELIRVADEQGWLLPTPVQAEAVPLILGGGDVLAAAETGSGKTGAFGVPILQIVHESLRDAAATSARAAAASDGAASSASSAADARMSVEDRNALFAVAPDGRLVQARGEKQWAGGRADVGVVAGKHYYEAVVMDDGLVRIGWSTSAGSLEGLGTDAQSFGFGGTGKIPRKGVRKLRGTLRQGRRRRVSPGLRRGDHRLHQERRGSRR